jgi:hypothetical protein
MNRMNEEYYKQLINLALDTKDFAWLEEILKEKEIMGKSYPIEIIKEENSLEDIDYKQRKIEWKRIAKEFNDN